MQIYLQDILSQKVMNMSLIFVHQLAINSFVYTVFTIKYKSIRSW